MAALNAIGLLVWGVNAALFFLLKRIRNIGSAMSAAISGWIAALVGVYILYQKKIPLLSFLTVSDALVFGIIVALLVIFLFYYASHVRNRMGILGDIGYWTTRIGWFIGGVMGFLVSSIQ